VDFLHGFKLNPTDEVNQRLEALGSARIKSGTTLAQFLRRPELSFHHLTLLASELVETPPQIALQAEVEIKYSGYVRRQLEGVERFKKLEEARLPIDLDYGAIHGLSHEVREKLAHFRPRSLGQAARISGITPAAVSLLSIYLKKQKLA
jgi:tRNA uridine 5-carboxymethylaminomethyl modification enzyme